MWFPVTHVKAGQPMLEVSSPDYSQLLDAYLKAADSYRLADKNYTRAQDLYQHHAIAERDLEQAESDRNQAQADLNAAEQGMKILGIKDPCRLGKCSFVGTDSGTALRSAVRSSSAWSHPDRWSRPAKRRHSRFRICSTVWVLANVYQADLAYVHSGDDVVVQTDAYPGSFHGRISYVSPAVDPNTRTLQARIIVDNPGEKLKRDMYCTVTVAAGSIANAVAVPNCFGLAR